MRPLQFAAKVWLVGFALLLPQAALAQTEADCDPAPGYREVALLGEQRDAVVGEEVAALGDVNGDGLDDFAVNAPSYLSPGNVFGLTYVIYGNPRQPSITLDVIGPDQLGSGAAGFVIVGAGGRLTAGGGLRPMGDLNGDGIHEFAVADPFALSPTGVPGGAVYLFYGRRANAGEPAFPSRIDLLQVGSGIYGDQVRVHYGPGIVNDQFGTAIQHLGDLNGDGRSDFMIGLPAARKVQLYLGQPGRPTTITPVLSLRGLQVLGNFGRALGGDFDFDADGINDVLACATNEDPRPFPAGNCYLLWGKSLLALGPEFVVDDLFPARGGDGSLGMVLSGGEGTAGLGTESRFIGTLDLNGDGRNDLVFGSPSVQPNGPSSFPFGRVYVLYGSSSPLPPQVSMASLAQAAPGPQQLGFVLEGPPVSFAYFGEEVVEAGDVNDDGIDDLLVTSKGGGFCGPSSGGAGLACGSAWVIMGRRGPSPFPPLTTVSVAGLAGGLGYRFGPTQQGSTQQFGIAAASLRDFTGDGKPEWLIGAHLARIGDGLRGKACLYLSGNGEIIAPPPVFIDAGTWRSWLAMCLLLMSAGLTAVRMRG